MQPEATVFVVDGDLSIREALRGLIATDGVRVECFASAREFLRQGPSVAPSCLVLDVRLPDVGGFELQRELIAAGREMPVIFMTAQADVALAVRAMKAGACEFLAKPFRGDDLLTAIREALERDRYARQQHAELALIRRRYRRLTEREAEVVTLIARGMLNKQIAAALSISENTIKAHRRHIMKKMGAANFAELVWMMVRL